MISWKALFLPSSILQVIAKILFKKLESGITLYRNSEKIYSKIFVKDVSLSPTDLDYITFYIGKRFPFRINYDDSFDTYFEFLPTDY